MRSVPVPIIASERGLTDRTREYRPRDPRAGSALLRAFFFMTVVAVGAVDIACEFPAGS